MKDTMRIMVFNRELYRILLILELRIFYMYQSGRKTFQSKVKLLENIQSNDLIWTLIMFDHESKMLWKMDKIWRK